MRENPITADPLRAYRFLVSTSVRMSGGTVYTDYVALLDENLKAVENGGLFAAIGSDNSGTADTVGKIRAAAGEIAKAANTGMTPEAIIKAWENNPELVEMPL